MRGSGLESTDRVERVVLVALAERTSEGECPTTALDLLEGCRRLVGDLDDFVVGRFTEAELFRSCHSLAATGMVTELQPDETSPVGKGRPEYELAVDPETVREFLRDDDSLADLVRDGVGDGSVES